MSSDSASAREHPSNPEKVALDEDAERRVRAAFERDDREDDAQRASRVHEVGERFREGMRQGRFVAGPSSPAPHILFDLEETCDRVLWYIGDIHGDLLAMRCLVAQARVASERMEVTPTIVFLGDFIDDGDDSHRVILELFELALDDNLRTVILAGNHDIALRPRGDGFTSSVSPCHFTNWLNHQPQEGPWRNLAEIFIEYMEMAPRAAFFGGGTLAVHGGFPHADLLDGIKTLDDLEHESCLSDFTWARFDSVVAPRPKRPNRQNNRSHMVNAGNLIAFVETLARIENAPPVDRLVRGHDHRAERFSLDVRELTAEKTPGVYTINAMSTRTGRERLGPLDRAPALLWQSMENQPAQIERLMIPTRLKRLAGASVVDVSEEVVTTARQVGDVVAGDDGVYEEIGETDAEADEGQVTTDSGE